MPNPVSYKQAVLSVLDTLSSLSLEPETIQRNESGRVLIRSRPFGRSQSRVVEVEVNPLADKLTRIEVTGKTKKIFPDSTLCVLLLKDISRRLAIIVDQDRTAGTRFEAGDTNPPSLMEF